MYKFSYFYKHDPEDSRWHNFNANDMKEVRKYLESYYDYDDGDLSFHLSIFDYMLVEMDSFQLDSITYEFKHIYYKVRKCISYVDQEISNKCI